MNIGVPLTGPDIVYEGITQVLLHRPLRSETALVMAAAHIPAAFPPAGRLSFCSPPSAGSYEILLHSQV